MMDDFDSHYETKMANQMPDGPVGFNDTPPPSLKNMGLSDVYKMVENANAKPGPLAGDVYNSLAGTWERAIKTNPLFGNDLLKENVGMFRDVLKKSSLPITRWTIRGHLDGFPELLNNIPDRQTSGITRYASPWENPSVVYGKGDYLTAETSKAFSSNPRHDWSYGRGVKYSIPGEVNVKDIAMNSFHPAELEQHVPRGSAFKIKGVATVPVKGRSYPITKYELESVPGGIKNVPRGAVLGKMLSIAPWITSAMKYADPSFNQSLFGSKSMNLVELIFQNKKTW